MRVPTSHSNRPRCRVACIQFSKDGTNALRSLLGLLDPYLKKNWEICEPDQADLVLLRVNEEQDGHELSPEGKPVIACVRRPRQHASPAIHVPLRASEILAVLNEFDAPGDNDPTLSTSSSSQATVAEVWRLGFWPLEFEKYPTAWQKVLAALTSHSMTAEDLAQCTHMRRAEIDQCLQTLRESGALEESTPSASNGPPPATGLRDFIAGIGRKLGLRT